jgi:predicted nucleic acid-binding protein
MAVVPKIYIESCPLIDMAKHRAKLAMDANPATQSQRENAVWFCKKILEAARNGDLEVYASAVSIGECTYVERGVPVSQDTQDFFNMLLCSGRSGIRLVQPMESLWVAARNLRWKENVNLKPMDSLHIATALHMGCSEFITTDSGIYKQRDKFDSPKLSIIQAFETKVLPDKYRHDEFADGAFGKQP